ncbi:MAG: 50S ribosomal protein L23 [Armatimonadetes bacterium]|nr:50S ribosomal protein L23 [Armatimonadota bacterium]
MSDYRAVIRRPVITEKSMRMTEQGKYTFEVAPGANKVMIREAVGRLFNVDVVRVHTITIPGKMKRRGQHRYHTAGRKKAIVTLAAGQKIDIEALTA